MELTSMRVLTELELAQIAGGSIPLPSDGPPPPNPRLLPPPPPSPPPINFLGPPATP
jgi:hypothetical protein